MRRYDDMADVLYDTLRTDLEPGSADLNPMKLYRSVLHKAGLRPAKRGWKRSTKVLLAAAVAATATLTVAATVYSAGDAFRGVLDVHDSAAGASAAGPILDRTGVVVGQTEKSGTVDLSLRAAVGDARTLRVLVDVVDNTGNPLAIQQPDGSRSDGYFALGDYAISKGGDMLPGSFGYEFIDIEPSANKFTILFTYMVTDGNIRGENLQLHFQDILQYGVRQGTALDMHADALYDIVSRFGGYTETDFRLSDWSQENGDGYLLHAAGDGGVSLSNDCSGVMITGATVRDGALYIQGTAASASQLDRILDNAALVGANGDLVKYSACSRGERAAGGGEIFSLRLAGIESPEALKGYVWYYGAGEGVHTAYAGSWDFSFKADIEDVSVGESPQLSTTWEGYPLTVNRLEISPYSVYLQYSTDEATAKRMNPAHEWGSTAASDWQDSPHPLILNMRDGTAIKVEGGSFNAVDGWADSGSTATNFEMHFIIDTVIDPSQVVRVTIGNQTLELKQ